MSSNDGISPETPVTRKRSADDDDADTPSTTGFLRNFVGYMFSAKKKRRTSSSTVNPPLQSNAKMSATMDTTQPAAGNASIAPATVSAPSSDGHGETSSNAASTATTLKHQFTPMFHIGSSTTSSTAPGTRFNTARNPNGGMLRSKRLALSKPSYQQTRQKQTRFSTDRALGAVSTTPYRPRSIYRKTPFKKTPTTPARDSTLPAASGPEAAGTATPAYNRPRPIFNSNRKRYKGHSAMLTSRSRSSIATPKLALAKKQVQRITQEILQRTPVQPRDSDSILFSDPSNSAMRLRMQQQRQRATMTRVLGSNQDGSRLNGRNYSNGNGHGLGNGEEVQSRRESAKKGAFQGEATSGNDYWSSPSADADASSMDRDTTLEPHFGSPTAMQTFMGNEQDSGVEMSAIKRNRVSFKPSTPGTDSKNDESTFSTNAVVAMPSHSTPYKVYHETKKQKNYVSRNGVKVDRDENGCVSHLPETIHGIHIDYSILGSIKGVHDSAAWDVIKGERTSEKKYRFYHKIRQTDASNNTVVASIADTASTPKSTLPFSFMPTETGSSKKGSSSILNKPLATSSTLDTGAPAPKPSSAPALGASKALVSTASKVTGGWGNLFSAKPGEWKCENCLVMNPKNASKCLSCDAEKPDSQTGGASKGATETNSSVPVTTSSSSNKSVGATEIPTTSSVSGSSSDSKPKFTFGAPKEAEKSATATGTATTSFSGGLKFGSKLDSGASSTGGFTFGTTKDESGTKQSDGLSFLAPVQEKDEGKTAAAPFVFPSKAPAPAKETEAKEPVVAAEPKDETKPKLGFSFGASSTPTPAPVNNKSNGAGFTFGADTNSVKMKDGTKPAITFDSAPKSSSEAKAPEAAAKPTFSFTPAEPVKTDPPASSMGFGSTSAGNDDTESTSAKKRSKRPADDTPAPKFQFGAGSSSIAPPAPATTKPFSFESSGTSASSSMGPPSSATSLTLAQAASTVPAPLPASGATFTFGSSSAPAPAAPEPTPGASFTFGASSTSPSAPANAPTPAAGSFSFGGSSTAPATAGGAAFSFGQSSSTSSAPAPPSTGPPFAFGLAAPAPAAPTTGGPSFTFGIGSTPAPAPSMSFGTAPTPAPAPQFGAPAPSAPNFGFGQAAAPAPTPGFGFGAQPAAPAQFGAPAPAPAGGFGFGAQPPAPVVPNMGVPAAPAAGGFSIGTGGAEKKRGRRVIRAKRPPSGR